MVGEQRLEHIGGEVEGSSGVVGLNKAVVSSSIRTASSNSRHGYGQRQLTRGGSSDLARLGSGVQ
jgi:hypothetical protein